MEKYSSIDKLDIDSFRHIIAGALFQMQGDCISRIREITLLVNGTVLFIDVVPGNVNQQILLCSNEREVLLQQLGASHFLSIHESKWPKVLEHIKNNQHCENGSFKGPFLISGLTEKGTDFSVTRNFLSIAFQDNNTFTWHKELGYYFPLQGTVVHGNQIGRTLGYPTLNIKPNDTRKILPPMGVYTGLIKISGKWHRTMINIGIRPTLDLSRVTIESHVFGFTDEIYGDTVTLHFTGRIRDEMRFSSLDQLKIQLDKDKKVAVSMLKKLNLKPSDKDEFLIVC